MSPPGRSEQPATIPLPGPEDGRGDPQNPKARERAGQVLEGLFVPSQEDRGAAVIAPPHPLYGGSMEHPVLTEVADACHRAGLASLRFNWRGVGASAGSPSGEPALGAADYAAALAFAEDSSEGPIVACGYSFGAASAATAARADQRVKALLLVAPPVAMLERATLKSFPGRILLISGDRDEYAPMEEIEALAGQLDNTEFFPLAGTNHFFMSGLAELGRESERFLKRIVSRSRVV